MDAGSGAHNDPSIRPNADAVLIELIGRAVQEMIAMPGLVIDDTIQHALESVGRHFDVDRAYLFHFAPDRQSMSNTHEWCAPGVEPQIANLQDLPTSMAPWWMAELAADRPINLASLSDLPAHATDERAILEPQGIQSLLVLPTKVGARLTGFVGFDHVRSSRRWTALEVALLRLLASALEQAFERRRMDRRIELAASVFDHAQEGIFVTDAEQRILEVNPSFAQITGYDRGEAVGRTPNMLSSGRHGPDFYQELWGTLERAGQWRGELWNRRKNGELYLESLTISTVRAADGHVSNYVGIFQDITQLKEQAERLEQMAYFDPLTKLPNRSLLSDRIMQALAQRRRTNLDMAVCYVDLDRFKPVNDQHGHAVGDRLLIEMGRRLKGALREGDTVARLGGDEFVLVLQGIHSEEECRTALDRVLASIREPFPVDAATSITLSGSIGVRMVPPDDADPDTLLRHADQAMYLAKQEGRSRAHVFDAERDRLVVERRDRLARIDRAMDAGEIVLHFQPILHLATGRVAMAEALVRWNSPVEGLLGPGQWLSVLEDEPGIVRLGAIVLESALAACSEWIAAGLEMAVSVNVSARDLREPGFVQRVREALARHPRLEPRHLELEIVETAALTDLSKAARVMSDCESIGVRFALDDFGTGYSSLTYLTRLPSSALKIDRSFVGAMLEDAEDRTLVAGIVGLARNFRRASIAEGVETDAHMQALRELGCDMAQGHAIAPPMPLPELLAWCRERNRSRR
jgi:diguanylate cyclase (GGDEF)-like protein/PAS domain S-box-containing protein